MSRPAGTIAVSRSRDSSLSAAGDEVGELRAGEDDGDLAQ